MANGPSVWPRTRITYSPKVFIPLTQLCRDRCGYCTFAQAPHHLPAPYLTLDEVEATATRGAQAGCHEALFTLGEFPEDRYPQARAWLDDHGYESTVDYLFAACQRVLETTGLLPHANAGALGRDDLARLRSVAPSQGMMIESLNPDLPAHRGAPDKDPTRRLATLEFAGELSIPFTTGILVGFGESRADRIAALEAIASSHDRHGHVQEVIVQNFVPKPGTTMRDAPPCSMEDLVDAIELARAILPSGVHVQAPPNLVNDIETIIQAGIDDFGGVSPITADYVNPERPWPSLDTLRRVSSECGLELTPRLTVYPEYVLDADTWIDEGLHFAVLDRSDAEGLARDDPGAVFPEKYQDAANVGTGAEVVQIGRRSTAWYSGADRVPTKLIPHQVQVTGAVREVLDGVRAGQRVEGPELAVLFAARGREVAAIAQVADELRARTNGREVTYVRNRNINYTNVCTYKCTFCGFSKGPLSLNLRGRPYLLDDDEISARVVEAASRGATEVCLQGGIHPDFDGDYYVRVTKVVKAAVPTMHVHGFTALEVLEGSRRLGEPLESYLQRMKDAGLASLPGTAAEILHDDIRAILCPDKVSTDEWLMVHETAHGLGLRSNVTIMFGSVEQPEHWIAHILATRALQERTGGFTEFIPLPFVHMASPVYLKRRARRGPTWREVVLMHAVGRIAYRGLIDNVQASWVKLGIPGVLQLLQAGVNDVGGTLMDENISRAAGAAHGQGMDPVELAVELQSMGRTLQQRTTMYQALTEMNGVAG